MTEAFKVGDQVALIVSGKTMIVTGISTARDHELVLTEWSEGAERKHGEFIPAALTLACDRERAKPH